MAAKHSYKLHHVSVHRACAVRYRVRPMPNCVDIVKLLPAPASRAVTKNTQSRQELSSCGECSRHDDTSRSRSHSTRLYCPRHMPSGRFPSLRHTWLAGCTITGVSRTNSVFATTLLQAESHTGLQPI